MFILLDIYTTAPRRYYSSTYSSYVRTPWYINYRVAVTVTPTLRMCILLDIYTTAPLLQYHQLYISVNAPWCNMQGHEATRRQTFFFSYLTNFKPGLQIRVGMDWIRTQKSGSGSDREKYRSDLKLCDKLWYWSRTDWKKAIQCSFQYSMIKNVQV